MTTELRPIEKTWPFMDVLIRTENHPIVGLQPSAIAYYRSEDANRTRIVFGGADSYLVIEQPIAKFEERLFEYNSMYPQAEDDLSELDKELTAEEILDKQKSDAEHDDPRVAATRNAQQQQKKK